jgi:hypothetical protein
MYKDLHIPNVNNDMPIQELKSIYEKVRADIDEQRMIKQKVAKQALKEDLIKKIFEPDADDKDVKCKELAKGINEYMNNNGISTENMKKDFVDMFVELATSALTSKFSGDPFNGGHLIKSFCDQNNITIDLNELFLIIEIIPILLYK